VVVVRLSTVSPGADVIVVVVSEVGCDGKINRDVAVVYLVVVVVVVSVLAAGPQPKTPTAKTGDSD
jgi:hypothetical protein